MIAFMVDDVALRDHPPTAVESVLIRLAGELLGLKEMSPADDLLVFEGASLVLARLTIQIEEHFDIEFPLVRIFEFSTLADLAVEVQRIIDSRPR